MNKNMTWTVVISLLILLITSGYSSATTPPTRSSSLPDGSVYSGEYSNGKFQGKGILEWRNGNNYTGEFRNGSMHGNGVMTWSNNEQYRGEFKDGLPHGSGELLMASGDKYQGEFENGYMHGTGELLMANGDRYKGEFKKGFFSGNGEFTYITGTKHTGEFAFGKFHGKGELQISNGDFYSGEFKDGLMHGQGNYKTKTGREYIGSFENDEFTGSGTLNYGRGNKYTGEFKNWEFDGEGELVTERGDTYKGVFKRGQLIGKGMHSSSNGNKYTGEFKNWTYNGHGELVRKSGEKYVGEFKFGQRHGKGKLIKTDKEGQKQIKSGNWEYGFLVGDREKEYTQRESRVETVLYKQKSMLDKTLQDLHAGIEGKIDLYFLGIAGHGSQEVFRKEVTYISNQFQEKYGTNGRSIHLINSKTESPQYPLATTTSIKRAIAEIEAKMNLEEDILFLYMTSHGSDKHSFSLSYDGITLPDIKADELADILDNSKIKYRVVMVSACYSGGFVAPVENEHTLVITAAAKDRKSFGCSDENEMTDFAKAYFVKALPNTSSFEDAFKKARKIVDTEEKERKIKQHSSPQLAMGSEIRKQLAKWRAQLRN